MRRLITFFAFGVLSLFLATAWTPAEAQFGGLKDKLKKKAKETVQEKPQEQKTPEPNAQEPSAQTPAEEQSKAEPKAGEEKAAAQAGAGTATSEDMTLYTKYDFIPGDRVIFYDDLSGEEIGEFPSRWNLDKGVFEIAKQGGRNYILCTDDGSIRPKIAPGPLPLKYTAELEFYVSEQGYKEWRRYLHLRWLNAKDEEIAEFRIDHELYTGLRILGKDLASKQLDAKLPTGLHTMRVMATKTTMKCYIDNERVANVPAVEGFNPVAFRVYARTYEKRKDNFVLLGSFRYAEGGKTMKEQLDEAGRIVTHGILFDSGSARIKAESYKTLADIGQLLTENPGLRVSIEGHTDSDGADDFNLKLSQDRASSVKTYLVETYKVDAGRLETKGFGESKPLVANDTPEGKATNRRVELVKL